MATGMKQVQKVWDAQAKRHASEDGTVDVDAFNAESRVNDRNTFTASAGTHFELMREFERGRKVAEKVGDSRCTNAGDPYVTLKGVGDESDARAAFATYAEGRNGILHWRTPPETGRFTFERNLHPGERYFYMRLFIEKD